MKLQQGTLPLKFKRLPASTPSKLTSKLGCTPIFDLLWKLAAERQKIFFSRVNGQKRPWTSDPILSKYKFTNAYRASDRTSQFLIKKVIYSGSQNPEELFFRIILFKLFNKIETWKVLESRLGLISYQTFSIKKYQSILDNEIRCGKRIYSPAYIMPSGGASCSYKQKHHMHLHLLSHMMKQEAFKSIQNASCFEDIYKILLNYKTIGPFLAYQYSIDINYSELTNFSESEFVKPGPGALRGIQKCFTNWNLFSPNYLIKITYEKQHDEFKRLNINFKNLWGRDLQLIDCQNLFCEVDKYSRATHPQIKTSNQRTKIKQKFTPSGPIPIPWYPPKWGINNIIIKDKG